MISYEAIPVTYLWDKATALGRPEVPEEHNIRAVWSPLIANGSGLIKDTEL